jgi:hypothetical protein
VAVPPLYNNLTCPVFLADASRTHRAASAGFQRWRNAFSAELSMNH